MIVINKVIRPGSKGGLVFLRLAASAFLLFLLSFFFLLYPAETAKSVSEGLSLCLNVVIPSLFPFMVISGIFVSSAVCEKLGRVFKKAISFLFSLSGACFCPVLVCLVGGYPTAAFCARQLYEKGLISRRDYQHLLLFAVNPSPSFAVGAVGAMLLGSSTSGAVIFFSVIIASLLLGLFSRLVKTEASDEDRKPISIETQFMPFSKSVVNAIGSSGKAMLFICFSVLFFSAVLSVTDRLFPTKNASMLCGALFEVTCGCKRCCRKLPVEIIAGIVGWGGLCTHFQVMEDVILSKLRVTVFMAFRLLHGALSVAVCSFLLRLFPQAVPTFLGGDTVLSYSYNSSLPLSLCLVAMCALLMLGNNFALSKKRKKKENCG